MRFLLTSTTSLVPSTPTSPAHLSPQPHLPHLRNLHPPETVYVWSRRNVTRAHLLLTRVSGWAAVRTEKVARRSKLIVRLPSSRQDPVNATSARSLTSREHPRS
jgi:hypothetical protein